MEHETPEHYTPKVKRGGIIERRRLFRSKSCPDEFILRERLQAKRKVREGYKVILEESETSEEPDVNPGRLELKTIKESISEISGEQTTNSKEDQADFSTPTTTRRHPAENPCWAPARKFQRGNDPNRCNYCNHVNCASVNCADY